MLSVSFTQFTGPMWRDLFSMGSVKGTQRKQILLPKSASPVLGGERQRGGHPYTQRCEWRAQKRRCLDDMIFTSRLCAGKYDYPKAYQGIGITLGIVAFFSSLPDIQVSTLHLWLGGEALGDDQRSQSRT